MCGTGGLPRSKPRRACISAGSGGGWCVVQALARSLAHLPLALAAFSQSGLQYHFPLTGIFTPTHPTWNHSISQSCVAMGRVRRRVRHTRQQPKLGAGCMRIAPAARGRLHAASRHPPHRPPAQATHLIVARDHLAIADVLADAVGGLRGVVLTWHGHGVARRAACTPATDAGQAGDRVAASRHRRLLCPGP